MRIRPPPRFRDSNVGPSCGKLMSMHATGIERGRYLQSRPMPDRSGIRLVAFCNCTLRWLGGCAATFCLCLPVMADDPPDPITMPSFAELQAARAVIGEVNVI